MSKTPSVFSALKKLISLFQREEKIKCVWMMVLAFCVSFSEIITATVIVIFAQILTTPEVGRKYLSKLGVVQEYSSAKTIFYFSVAVGLIYLIKNTIAAIEVFFQNFTVQKMNYNFKNRLLEKYSLSDYGTYLTKNSAVGVQIIGGDTERAFSVGMIAFASVVSEAVIFLALVSMIIYLNPGLSLVIFTSGVSVSLFVYKFLLPKFYLWGQRLQHVSVLQNKWILQFFHGFKEVVVMGKRNFFIEEFKKNSREKSYVQAMQGATNMLPRLAIEVLFVGMFVVTITYLCSGHEAPVKMIGLLSGYLYAGFRLMPGLNRMVSQLNMFKSCIPSIEKVYDEYQQLGIKETYVDSPKLSFTKKIVFEGVSFRYLNTKKDVLSNINLEIQKGETIGLVGETGSGKSTLVDLLLGLLRPTHGSVSIDKKYPVNSYQWHNKIGYVPQSVYLTDDTIAANIAFGEKEIDKKKLKQAIDDAQLSKLMGSLPLKEDTIVGERGIRLSGGERQRIAIARALYRNPEVLIFDEATSALDKDTESRLMKTIYDVSKNRTVIMIAHRLTTLEKCDRIIKVRDHDVSVEDRVGS